MRGLKTTAFMVFTCLLFISMVACNELRDAGDPSIRSFDRQQTNDSQSMSDHRGIIDVNRYAQRQNNRMYINDSENQHPRPDMAHQPRLIVSQEIADAIAQLDGIESAGVMLTDRNAYVAVMMDEIPMNDRTRRSMNTDVNRQLDIEEGMKEEIAKTVRSMNPNVENVYVSANPDFVDRFNGIVDHMANGRPLRGLINEFNVLIERIFPENS